MWTADTISEFGNYVTSLAMSVLVVVTLRGTATQVGLVNAAGWVPYLLFGLVVGAAVDRRRRRPVLIAADLGRGLLLLAVPVLSALGRLHIGAVIAVAGLLGTFSLVGDAAFQALIPRLAPQQLLTEAHARLDQSGAVAQTSGPALAGALIALVGAPLAVLVDAGSFLASAALLTAAPIPEPATTRVKGDGSVLTEVKEGLRWVYRHDTLRPLALGTHAWFFFMAIAGAAVTPFALRTVKLNPFALGLTLGAAGLGGLLGALVAVRLGRRFGAGHVIIASRAGTAVAWALIALSPTGRPGWALFGLGQLLLGAGLGAENANEMGYRQTVTPDRLQGRMNTTMRSLNRAAIVVGAPLGGILGDHLGYRTALWAAVAGFLVVTVALISSRLRGAHLGDDYTL